jgi:hypothetical protein
MEKKIPAYIRLKWFQGTGHRGWRPCFPVSRRFGASFVESLDILTRGFSRQSQGRMRPVSDGDAPPLWV